MRGWRKFVPAALSQVSQVRP